MSEGRNCMSDGVVATCTTTAACLLLRLIPHGTVHGEERLHCAEGLYEKEIAN